MKKAIEDALKAMAKATEKEQTADYAMKFSQATLNLAHALATLENLPKKLQ